MADRKHNGAVEYDPLRSNAPDEFKDVPHLDDPRLTSETSPANGRGTHIPTSSELPGSPTSKREKLKAKTKKILHVGGSSSSNNDSPSNTYSDSSAPTSGPGVDHATLAPAPQDHDNDARYTDHEPPHEEHSTVKDKLKQPVSTLTTKVRGQGGQQFAEHGNKKEIPHGKDVRLVQETDRVERARSGDEKREAERALEDLEKERQDAKVRWVLDRHVHRVKRVPAREVRWKGLGEFRKVDPKTGKVGTDWIGWIEYVAYYYAEKYGFQYIGAEENEATRESLQASIERLLVALAPFQRMVMSMRRVYTWEQPRETFTYLCIYYFLWAIDYLGGAALAMIIYTLLRRHFYPPNIEDMREKVERSEDPSKTALDINELIEQQGSTGWVDPLIERLGPWLSMQLSDGANMFEVLWNLYEWKEPRRTAQSLAKILALWIAVTFVPIYWLVKGTTFFLGFMFFALYPIGANHPEYRLLVSPTKWLTWKVPTHAEWAVSRLQAEALNKKHSFLRNASPDNNSTTTTTADEPRDTPHEAHALEDVSQKMHAPDSRLLPTASVYGSYKCHSPTHTGTLLVTATGLRFEARGRLKRDIATAHLPDKLSPTGRNNGNGGDDDDGAETVQEGWELRYEEIVEMQKVTRVAKVGSGDDLVIRGRGGREFRCKALADKDEVFTQVVGWSGLQWQILE